MVIKKNCIYPIFLILISGVWTTSCQDEQRDLYGKTPPDIWIEGNFIPSLGRYDMSNEATVIAFAHNDTMDAKYTSREFFVNPCHLHFPISRGDYSFVVLNGLIYSENDTHLDHILLRGMNRASTFEAYSKETKGLSRFSTRAEETLMSNEMEHLAIAVHRHFTDSDPLYQLKYRNGKNGHPIIKDFVNPTDTIRTIPIRLTHNTQVFVTLINPQSARSASGVLHGFAASVFVVQTLPSQQLGAHHLKLNNMKITEPYDPTLPFLPEKGTIESPKFVSFGPPLNLPGRTYSFELNILLKNNQEIDSIYDITPQILPIIERIKEHRQRGNLHPEELQIKIHLTMKLPIVTDIGNSVGVGKWDDEEIVVVPIKPTKP